MLLCITARNDKMPPMHSSTIHIKDTCRNASLGNGGFNRTPWTPSTLFRNLLVAKIMNHLLTVLRAPFPICTQPLEISLVCDSNRTIVELLKLNFQHAQFSPPQYFVNLIISRVPRLISKKRCLVICSNSSQFLETHSSLEGERLTSGQTEDRTSY